MELKEGSRGTTDPGDESRPGRAGTSSPEEHDLTRDFASLVALSTSSPGGLSQDSYPETQEPAGGITLCHPLTRAVFHKALPAKAKEYLRDAPARWCGSKDLQCWAWGEAKEILSWG